MQGREPIASGIAGLGRDDAVGDLTGSWKSVTERCQVPLAIG